MRWLFLGVCGALLAPLVVSGILAVRFLTKCTVKSWPSGAHWRSAPRYFRVFHYRYKATTKAVQQFVADALADRAEPSRQHLDQLTLEIDSDLKRYPVDRDSTEAALLNGLQDVFLQQRTVYISVLARRPDELRRGQNVIADQMAPLQKKVLEWSTKLQTWNGNRLKNADRGAGYRLRGGARRPDPGADNRFWQRLHACTGGHGLYREA